eukprot:scaffold24225_cov21-Tisochrysis_lutea.AAC.1
MAAAIAANPAECTVLVILMLWSQHVFAVSGGAVNASFNFMSSILDMTTAFSVCPAPPVRDLKRESWTN